MSNANEAGPNFGADLWVGATHGNVAALRTKDGTLVATMANNGMDVRTAEEIARRWNAHPDLLAACEAVLAWVEDESNDVWGGLGDASEKIRAAIRKARGAS